MDIEYAWDGEYAEDKMGVLLNPANKHLADTLEEAVVHVPQLEVIDPTNDRRIKLPCSDVLAIEAMDHLSKVHTVDNKVYFIKGRLKDFAEYTPHRLFRINNSIILNLSKVVGFKSGRHARLEVYTTDGQRFIVSRHYAKQIKEALQ